jgi:hypothetical protein
MKIFAVRRLRALVLTAFGLFGTAGLAGLADASAAQAQPFINRFPTISTIASAVPTSGPATGDQNPYGVALVPHSAGDLVRGDVLVSNFNNALNQQGTGSSIVEIAPGGKQHVFAVVPAPGSTGAVGLTTALAVLPHGFVVVGSLPAPDGDSTRAGAGALTILNSHGHVVKTITAPDINGPWDMTAVDRGGHTVLFFTNVLNGTVAANGAVVDRGTVVRITLGLAHDSVPEVTSNQVIATGFAEHTDPNALVVGPTGVGLGRDGTLYVADSNGSRIAAVPDALTRTTVLGGGGLTVTSGGALNDPLGLLIAPNGNIVTANGADGRVVETSPSGVQVADRTLVADGGGDLFGLALAPHANGMYFVDDAGSGDAANSLQLLH